jgi:tetratricopeptide (TPR) repeat protein
MRLRSAVGGLLIGMVAVGCTPAWYYPDRDGFPKFSPEDAWSFVSTESRGKYYERDKKGGRIEQVDLVWNGVRFTLAGNEPVLCAFDQLRLSAFTMLDSYLVFVCDVFIHHGSAEAARKYAGALYVLQEDYQSRQKPESPEKIAAFEAVVKEYRAGRAGPELPEAAKRFKVQAEFAVQEKRFDDAVSLYAKASDVAPWWPQGHYNRGLLLGELSAYTEAVRELQKYLKLEPGAPNAHAVQEQIYRWESVAK